MTVSSDLLSSMNGVPPTTSSTSASAGGLTSSSAAATQANFLTMLTAQLQNQDPTNPMDNSQLTSQIAQLSTVTGIEQLNSSMTSLMTSLQTGQTMQAASLIGHSVLAPGSSLTLQTNTTTAADGTTSTTHGGIFGVQLASNADSVQVSIKDSTGKVVDTIDLGNQAAGTVPIIWDGTQTDGTVAADGQYTFAVSATAAGVAVASTNLGFGTVSSVTANAGGSQLNVANIGTINMSDIVQIM
ncbi:MAG: flagellar basal body rod modification protein FlgD [Herbaspirillum sp.]|nr:flagellar basal body rod modification protein FlgD [Herbaspirillum sp.]